MENTENNTEIDVEITSEKIQEEAVSNPALMTESSKKTRGRKKKVGVVESVDESGEAAVVNTNTNHEVTIKPTDCEMGIGYNYNSLRNYDGLIKNLQYKYDSYGFVDWRAMINPKHVVLNRNSVAKAGLNYEALSDADREKFLVEWPDEKKIIKLAGFKEVARLRGYNSVNNRVEQFGEKVICHCTIEWLPNCDGYFTYTAAASASPANVAPEYSQALEAIACNRAFARAVRESLNIHVVSDEELDPNKVEEVSNAKIPSTHPRAQLIKKCGDMGIEFPAVKTMIVGLGLDNIDIVSFDTIPGPTAMSVLDEVRKSQVK